MVFPFTNFRKVRVHTPIMYSILPVRLSVMLILRSKLRLHRTSAVTSTKLDGQRGLRIPGLVRRILPHGGSYSKHHHDHPPRS